MGDSQKYKQQIRVTALRRAHTFDEPQVSTLPGLVDIRLRIRVINTKAPTKIS